MASRKGCLSCIRGLLLTSSVIFLIIGDIIAGIGIYFFLFDSQKAMVDLNTSFPREFFAFKLTLILCGSFIVLVSFCACVGILLNSKCALTLYSLLTGLLVIGFSAGSVVLVAVPSIGSRAYGMAETRLKHSYGNTSLIAHCVDSLQTKLECCGWHTPAASSSNGCDWFSGTSWKPSNELHQKECPPSCCFSDHQKACTKDRIHTKGCFSALSKYMIAAPLVLVGGVLLSMIHLVCVLVLVFKQARSHELMSSI